MNNNRGNNRRRGRGNNRPQGGGQQLNRIDSRARGNAPQLLEKYKKLAHDAHLNGDRVTAEYYLQFADHYFRVIADTRVRQEESRVRRDDRWQEADEAEDGGDFTAESDFPSFDQPVYSRRPPEERARENMGRENGGRENNGREDRRPEDRRPRDQRESREQEAESLDGEGLGGNAYPDASAEGPALENENGVESASPYEPAENPFVRDNRVARGLRPRRDDRPRRNERSERAQPRAEAYPAEAASGPVGEPALFDASILPPAIKPIQNEVSEAGFQQEIPSDSEPPAPRRRRTRKAVEAEASDATEG